MQTVLHFFLNVTAKHILLCCVVHIFVLTFLTVILAFSIGLVLLPGFMQVLVGAQYSILVPNVFKPVRNSVRQMQN